MAKKEISTDVGISTIIKKYGNVIKSGTEVFAKNKERKNVPVSMSFDNGLNGGLAEGTWTVISGPPKSGKAQDMDSLVYTPNGPVKMRDIKIGQYVLTPFGTRSKVVGVWPQGKKKLYMVSFDDGSSTLCCKEHLWVVSKNNGPSTTQETLSTRQLMLSGVGYYDRPKWKIKLTEPVDFDECKLDIDPYVAGILLSDSKDGKKKIMLNDSVPLNLISRNGYIPACYKYNSVENRKRLLQGLFDSHAKHYSNGTIEYRAESITFAEDISEIAQSLGFKAHSKKLDRRHYVYVNGGNTNTLFSIESKCNKPTANRPRSNRSIKSIVEFETRECQCITIEDERGLYLTDNFIITHNSTVSLQVISNGQKMGKKGYYIDAESRLSNYNLAGINGLNVSEIKVIAPDGEENLSAEAVFSIIEMLIKDPQNRGCVIVLDSISTLLPQSEMDADVSATLRASLPKMITHWGKKIQQKVRSNDIILIIITHYITNTSGYGKKNIADSGTFIQYQASNRIDFLKTEDWEEGDKKVGIKISAEIDCSANGSSGKIITSYVRFGKGIDSIKETIELGESFGLIDKAGAWYTIPCVERVSTQKFQGAANLYAFLEQNEDIVAEIRSQLESMLV